MNDTKWNELFKCFYQNECDGSTRLVYWRTKDIETGYVSNWDGTWTHFGCEPREWETIDYLQIALTDENREFVIEQVKRIHVPGTILGDMITIYGYRQDVDYI